MKRRWVVYGVVAVALFIGAAVVYDALVETDAERIEVFADAVTGEVSPEKISEGLAWCDPDRQPVEVYVMGASRLYDTGSDLADRAREGMSRFMGQELRPLNQTIEVDGDQASLRMRVLSNQLGMVNAAFDFRRRDERWLISAVRITR